MIKKVILIVLGCCVGIYFLILKKKSDADNAINPLSVSVLMPDEYRNIFNDDAFKKIKVESIVKFKSRSPIFYGSYNDAYDIEITKININRSFNLIKDIVLNTVEPQITSDPYLPGYKANFTTNYKTVSSERVSKVFLSLDGDSIKTVLSNDSVASFYLHLNSMSIQYKSAGPSQFFAKANDKIFLFKKKQPVSLMFLKKENELYFLLFSYKNKNSTLNPNLLYSLLKHTN